MSAAFRTVVVGPRPPDRSGIAEYAEGLMASLRQCGMDVEAVGHADLSKRGLEEVLRSLRSADAVVYQMGNHPDFHGWMLPLMSAVPGIVHLHDLVLHHMAVTLMHLAGGLDETSYADLLSQWHPPGEVESALRCYQRGSPVWSGESALDLPLFQVATKSATEVIVHSKFAARRIERASPWQVVNVISQVYSNPPAPRTRDSLDRVVMLGGGESNRRFDWVAAALKRLDPHLDKPLTLEVAGDVSREVEPALDVIDMLSNVILVRHGRLDDDAFRKAFERADLMIALRQPTMGETSAVVSKALQAGLPTVVSDHGWYTELPPCVARLAPDNTTPEALASLLQGVIAKPTAFRRWAMDCSDYARRPVLDPLAAAERYASVLRRHRVLSGLRDRAADAAAEMATDATSPLHHELRKIDLLANLRSDAWTAAALHALRQVDVDAGGRLVSQSAETYPYGAPLPDSAFRGAVVATLIDESVPRLGMMELMVEVHNHGDSNWLSPRHGEDSEFGIYLGYHWRPVDGDGLDLLENPRTLLAGVVAPGESASQKMTIRAPERPGEYILEIDLVQEQVSWFRERGGMPARLPLTITVGTQEAIN